MSHKLCETWQVGPSSHRGGVDLSLTKLHREETMCSSYNVQTFYFFKPLQAHTLPEKKAWLVKKAEELGILGLVILSPEGFNCTLASLAEKPLNQFVRALASFFNHPEFSKIKKSQSQKAPFRRFSVKMREEVVTLGKPELVPKGKHRHLNSQQWHQMLDQEDVVVIDTRNDYEMELGTFEKALNLNIKEFREFPEKIKNLNSPKSKPHMIFCTGGIRCEKAIYEMEQQGYTNVFQLDGGILNYMEQFPEGKFKGECFVFDSRVSINKNLEPSSRYSLCPQCGGVASIEINCQKCEAPSKLCQKCIELIGESPEYETCSKNCRYHYARDPHTKGPQQAQFYHPPKS